MKSILITGATSGIGNHLIKILANSDYKIYFIGRNKEKCERLVKELKNKFNFQELSMGMSSDYLFAIKYNATFLRIGSDIFGPRS